MFWKIISLCFSDTQINIFNQPPPPPGIEDYPPENPDHTDSVPVKNEDNVDMTFGVPDLEQSNSKVILSLLFLYLIIPR